MERLITPEEVVRRAFCCAGTGLAAEISEATIVAAERKYLLPVFGAEMMAQMAAGNYAEIVEKYVQPALALYVKRLLLPALAVKVGTAGVIKYIGEGFEPADESQLRRLVWRTKFDADALIDEAVEIVEASPQLYPHYNAANNVRHRVDISSGIVL